ncbi:collagen alpha-1(III) chain-like [Lynx rufus]|uniref:collagen alpha-1(III) chain-like n=1 Tax=Lynx rufus TaxID=61384 RepID=UPI001F1263D6|nr:collagen alpha-1(III) chain-like [Lynx rufus]
MNCSRRDGEGAALATEEEQPPARRGPSHLCARPPVAPQHSSYPPSFARSLLPPLMVRAALETSGSQRGQHLDRRCTWCPWLRHHMCCGSLLGLHWPVETHGAHVGLAAAERVLDLQMKDEDDAGSDVPGVATRLLLQERPVPTSSDGRGTVGFFENSIVAQLLHGMQPRTNHKWSTALLAEDVAFRFFAVDQSRAAGAGARTASGPRLATHPEARGLRRSPSPLEAGRKREGATGKWRDVAPRGGGRGLGTRGAEGQAGGLPPAQEDRGSDSARAARAATGRGQDTGEPGRPGLEGSPARPHPPHPRHVTAGQSSAPWRPVGDQRDEPEDPRREPGPPTGAPTPDVSLLRPITLPAQPLLRPRPVAVKEASLPARPRGHRSSPCGSRCWQRGGTSRADEPETDPGDTILRLDSPGGTARGQLVKDTHHVTGASGPAWDGLPAVAPSSQLSSTSPPGTCPPPPPPLSFCWARRSPDAWKGSMRATGECPGDGLIRPWRASPTPSAPTGTPRCAQKLCGLWFPGKPWTLDSGPVSGTKRPQGPEELSPPFSGSLKTLPQRRLQGDLLLLPAPNRTQQEMGSRTPTHPPPSPWPSFPKLPWTKGPQPEGAGPLVQASRLPILP